jgi:hypothetical protein
VNNPRNVKENYEHTSDFALHFLLGESLFCLRVIIINPTLVTSDNLGQEDCIIRGDLTTFLTDIDMLMLPISC